MKENKKVLLIEGENRLGNWILGNYGKVYSNENIISHLLDIHDFDKAEKWAIEVIDDVFEKHIKQDEKAVLNKIMGDAKGRLILKKALLYSVRLLKLSCIFAEKAVNEYEMKVKVDFIPKNFDFALYRMLSGNIKLLPDNITIPDWFIALSKTRDFIIIHLYGLALWFYPVLLPLWMLSKKATKPNIKKYYKNGVYLWETDYGFSRMHGSMDFLIKEKILNKKDVLFIIDSKVPSEYLSILKATGYNYCYFDDLVGSYSFGMYMRKIFKKASKISLYFKGIKTKMLTTVKVYLRVLHSIILWEMFYSKTHVKTFIAMQEPGNATRVLWQNKHNSRSIFINISSSLFTHITYSARTYYTMMVYDKYISSMLPIKGSRKNNNQIDEYKDIGIINSDYIHRIRKNDELVTKYKSDLGIPIDKTIISVFDSNADGRDVIPISDVMFFMRSILKLLDSNEEYFFIFKPRTLNIFNRDIELRRTFEQLINHNRCFFAKPPNFPYAACELIGISDLVITVFSSSILTEALSGGIKTVCFAPRNSSYSEFGDTIGKIPNLCFKSYEQLQGIVEYWLMDIKDEKFKTWRNEYVKNYIDRYCDGQALLRLRCILT